VTGNRAVAVTFDDLVTAATVGVTRKPLSVTAVFPRGDDSPYPPVPDGPADGHTGVLDAGDPAAALLDAAAMDTVARRAGFQPLRGLTPPDVPPETAPVFSARAVRALRTACDWATLPGSPGSGSRGPGLPGSGARAIAADNPVLPDLLTAAAAAGYVAHPLLLPVLLDAAVRRTALRPVVAPVLGARGRWLAAQRPDWRQALGAGAGQGPGPGEHGDPETWRTGTLAQRRAYLTSLRAADPDAARDLLAAGWVKETGTDRGQLISVLARGLSASDEEFLEAALDDRHGTVRAAARRLLGQLPRSAFSQRAARRAEGVLRLEQRAGRRALVATLPGEPDAAALRDGITAKPPVSWIRTGAWLLTQVIAAAPLTGWTARLDLAPEEIVALRVAGDLGPDVHAGLRLATVSQGSADWARALLAADGPGPGASRPAALWPADPALAALLPPAARAARAAALLSALPLTTANPPGWAGVGSPLLDEIAAWPGPWPDVLADAALSLLVRAAALPNLPPAARTVITAGARCLPAAGPRDYAAWLTRLADAHPQAWSSLPRSAATVIGARRVFLEEIRRT
jgi:hypothetical protein